MAAGKFSYGFPLSTLAYPFYPQCRSPAPVAAMSSSNLPRGTIAAIAVVVGLVVIAAVACLILFLRRQRRAARLKESFIVNPTIAQRRRSLFTRYTQTRQGNNEKERRASNRPQGSTDADILDITASKDDGDDDDEYDDAHRELDVPRGGHNGRGSRHTSQNSDGSYSIGLPELPGLSHVRTESDSPSPTHRFVTFLPTSLSPIAQSPVPPHSPPQSQRSPKPRGPRDMRNTLSVHARDSSRGILLKEMYTNANIPTDVQSDGNSPTTGIDYLPQPVVSPLRVNFEDDINEASSERRRGRFRSGLSAVSLPYSLKQALWGHPRSPTESEPPEVTVTDTDTGQMPRYSFLDMESTASHSRSGSHSTSTRPSRSTSTRSSSKSKSNQGSEHSTRPSLEANVPPVPIDPRISYGISMTMAGGPTSSRPSLSPDISLQAVPLPPITVPPLPIPRPENTSLGVHPAGLPDLIPSPTDSIPLTVSDIHFRHSVQSTTSRAESRRTSHRLSGSHRVPHPPLPSPPAQQVEHRPYIVQRLLGQTVGSGPSTPYGSPTVSGFTSQRGSRGRGGAFGPPRT